MKKTPVCCGKCGNPEKSKDLIEGICIPCALNSDKAFQKMIASDIRDGSKLGYTEEQVRQQCVMMWMSVFRVSKPTTLAEIGREVDFLNVFEKADKKAFILLAWVVMQQVGYQGRVFELLAQKLPNLSQAEKKKLFKFADDNHALNQRLGMAASASLAKNKVSLNLVKTILNRTI